MLDWTKVVAEAAKKGETARRAEKQREETQRAESLARMSAVGRAMEDVVWPVLTQAEAALTAAGHKPTVQRLADTDPANPWPCGVVFQIHHLSEDARRSEASTSDFKIQCAPQKDKLDFCTTHGSGMPGANESVATSEITTEWVEERLQVFIEDALS
jgi:hypothetical protein